MSESKEPKFWDCEDSEILTHTDTDEAIEDCLSSGGETPDEIVVKGYAPMELPSAEKLSEVIVEHLIEQVCADFDNPEGGSGDNITDTMIAAAKEFAEVFRDEYEVWACEVVCSKVINVREWMKANRPDYLEEES